MSDSVSIIAESIKKTYRRGPNEITPLQDLSLQVERGEFVALMGPRVIMKSRTINVWWGGRNFEKKLVTCTFTEHI